MDSIYQVSLSKKEVREQIDFLNESAVKYKSKDFTTANALAEKALDLAEKNSYSDGTAIAYRNLGIVSMNQGKYDDAQNHYNKALAVAKSPKVLGQIYGSIGRLKAEVSDFLGCVEYQFKALELFEKTQSYDLQYVTLSNIANTYIQLNEIEKYKEYKNKALAVKELVDKQKAPVVNILPTNKETPSEKPTNHDALAATYFEKKLEDKNDTEDPFKSSSNLLALGKINIQKGKFTQAKAQLTEALTLAQKIGNKILEADILKHFGDYYFALRSQTKSMDDLYLAIDYYKKALPTFIAEKQYLNATDSASNLGELYELLGDYKQANFYQKKAKELDDKVFTSSTKSSAQNIENQYLIKIKNQQLQIQQLELKSKEKQRLFLIVVALALAVLGSLFWYLSRVRKKRNIELRQLNEELDQANRVKTRFFSILNHDLRGPVSKIISYLQLQKHPEILDEETNKRLQEQTIDGAENLLTSMEDLLLWSKGQMENFKPAPKLIQIDDVFNDTKKVFSGYHNISFEYHNPEHVTLTTDIDYLKTIVRNLTSNAINVFTSTQNPTIVWKAWVEDEKVLLSIHDNGPGASLDKFKALYDENVVVGIKTGLGLHLIRDLAKAIGCEILVDSKINEGTTITLQF
ncbi:MAG: tetratricopeptide repeat-containing sensor histidine kinase [Flavobacterium sp.]|nr:tetratricopeptide repeat-containing sensor histidine kinase [Flavobacterium sp.]